MSMTLMTQAMSIEVGNPIRKLVLIKLADNGHAKGLRRQPVQELAFCGRYNEICKGHPIRLLWRSRVNEPCSNRMGLEP